MFFISKEYLTVGEEQEVSGVAGRSFGEGFQWWKTRTRCGVVIQEVTPRVAGDWLCHLADTSSLQESVRDERLIRVLIASRAVIRLSLEVNGETEAASHTKLHLVTKLLALVKSGKTSMKVWMMNDDDNYNDE